MPTAITRISIKCFVVAATTTCKPPRKLVVKTATKAGSLTGHAGTNHAAKRLVVKTATKAGSLTGQAGNNHAVKRLAVKTATKAGLTGQAGMNHAAKRLTVKRTRCTSPVLPAGLG